jgi:DNA-binding NarL/FixJ family response regulator
MATDDNDDRLTVLVVDDHEMVAEALLLLLEETEFEGVGRAGSVEEACRVAREVRPRFVVMDYRLPDGTGADATARLKRELPDTDVVMLTGQADVAALSAALQAGCSGFLAKEESFEKLVGTIRRVGAGEAVAPPGLLKQLVPRLPADGPTIGCDLSDRERQVLALLADGCSTADLAAELTISLHTVRNHIRNILSKLHAASRLQAVAIATRNGILPPVSPDR